jgi:hypothetical protein
MISRRSSGRGSGHHCEISLYGSLRPVKPRTALNSEEVEVGQSYGESSRARQFLDGRAALRNLLIESFDLNPTEAIRIGAAPRRPTISSESQLSMTLSYTPDLVVAAASARCVVGIDIARHYLPSATFLERVTGSYAPEYRELDADEREKQFSAAWASTEAVAKSLDRPVRRVLGKLDLPPLKSSGHFDGSYWEILDSPPTVSACLAVVHRD